MPLRTMMGDRRFEGSIVCRVTAVRVREEIGREGEEEGRRERKRSGGGGRRASGSGGRDGAKYRVLNVRRGTDRWVDGTRECAFIKSSR